MSAPFQVKLPFFASLLPLCAALFALFALAAAPAKAAEPMPEAREILRTVRLSGAVQNEALRGVIRHSALKIPFRIVFGAGSVRYEFSDPPSTVVLRMGDTEAKLSEVTKEGAERISGARFSDSVRGSDISYEDLSLRFLYWSKATVLGEETKLFRKCWMIKVEAPQVTDSQYSTVTLWIDKESGALMQAEALDRRGKFARRFKVVSGQKFAGAWYLKQMKIEAPGADKKDKSPTYLEVELLERQAPKTE